MFESTRKWWNKLKQIKVDTTDEWSHFSVVYFLLSMFITAIEFANEEKARGTTERDDEKKIEIQIESHGYIISATNENDTHDQHHVPL